jgi:hypothetical protein
LSIFTELLLARAAKIFGLLAVAVSASGLAGHQLRPSPFRVQSKFDHLTLLSVILSNMRGAITERTDVLLDTRGVGSVTSDAATLDVSLLTVMLAQDRPKLFFC